MSRTPTKQQQQQLTWTMKNIENRYYLAAAFEQRQRRNFVSELYVGDMFTMRNNHGLRVFWYLAVFFIFLEWA